jgi:AraC-like DNA-binding protein
MPSHSSGESISLEVHGNRATYSYRFALREHRAYSDIAFSTIGEFLDMFRYFVGTDATPRRILIDCPCPPQGAVADEVFACPVKWNSRRLGIEFAASLLTRPRVTAMPLAPVTFEDVQRAFHDGPPTSFAGRVSEVLRLQIQESEIDVERGAQSLDIGVRSLQRRLGKENTSFRELSTLMRMERAMELMRLGQHSVAEISSLLGYSSSNNFSRAFKSHMGLAPSDYMAAIKT